MNSVGKSIAFLKFRWSTTLPYFEMYSLFMQFKETMFQLQELNTLKEKLVKIETEKNDLTRKNDFFRTKQKHSSVYYGEILKREKILKVAVKDLNT